MEGRKLTRKEGALLGALLLLGIALYFLLQPKTAGDAAVLELDGAAQHTIQLAALESPVEYTLGGAVIEVSRAGARFVSSPCRDKICVNAGLISRAGEAAVCLPQRVSVRITGDGGVDAVTG